ncbi:hypothetical protein [Neobacillus ginsengisoli]|uniref:Polyhydroxyalkanoate synthesis regulator phasin n=1 Tax=Neobacillus ginsengisoli TaxID=904295 RepID=A0ABT9Y2D4_9BACI|nr:hypothetical protein [Neobacillus ginsengisoli]MDQ0201911.1 polyhydroxyalkanoate synthesis regulator phasin [Neobacillus ginsengisoli]
MKVKSSLIVPILAASILVPTVGNAMANQKTDSSNTSASIKKEDQKGTHQKWGKGEKQKELFNIVNQYASPQLKVQLTKDLTTRVSLMKQLRQTPGFQKKEEQEKAVHQAHKQEIDAIKQQVKDGKLTKQQAQSQIEALFGKEKGKDQDKDKGKEREKGGIYQELKAAIQKKDRAAINSALEKLEQKLERSNQQLQQKINANK